MHKPTVLKNALLAHYIIYSGKYSRHQVYTAKKCLSVFSKVLFKDVTESESLLYSKIFVSSHILAMCGDASHRNNFDQYVSDCHALYNYYIHPGFVTAYIRSQGLI